MLIPLVQLLGGFILLVWGADRLVAGASATARNLRRFAADHWPDHRGVWHLGSGNGGIGSRRFPGQTGAGRRQCDWFQYCQHRPDTRLYSIIYPLRVESQTLKREYPQLMLIMITCFIMAANLQFSRLEGVILLVGLAALIVWMVRLGMRKEPDDPLAQEYDDEIPSDIPTRSAMIWLGIGLLVLPLSSHFLVQGAISIARMLEVSETVIGLTIVALGTTLPELAASLTSALRKEDDLAIGNIIGSNMFNILGVLGIAATIKPVSFERSILVQDMPFMFLFTVLLFFMAYGIRGPGRIRRSSGILLLVLFLVYQAMVWITAENVVI